MPERVRLTRALSRAACLSIAIGLSALSPFGEAGEGRSAVVLTRQGEYIEGRLNGATADEVTIQAADRLVVLKLRDVAYISFQGRLDKPGEVPPTTLETPASRLRMDADAHERAGRLDDASRIYDQALKVDPDDPRTIKSRDRVRKAIGVREALPYKRQVSALRDAGRFAEAAACYDEALRLDPTDLDFRQEFHGVRHYWQPTTCPIQAVSPTPMPK